MNGSLSSIQGGKLPQHLGIIMDGNGRWAKRRNLPRIAGHKEGVKTAEKIIRFVADDVEIKYLSLYAFSTENWSRPATEIAFLMDLLKRFIENKIDEFEKNGVHLRLSGDMSRFPEKVRNSLSNALERTAGNNQFYLNVALNYGGRQEIVYACRRLMEKARKQELEPEMLSEEILADHLYTAGMPYPDLVIRTSGERRLSNFLLWQAAYSELYFDEAPWPDFTSKNLVNAISAYQERTRRFGGVPEEEQ